MTLLLSFCYVLVFTQINAIALENHVFEEYMPSGRGNSDVIHRFFDSSPFTANEEDVVLVELPKLFDSSRNTHHLPFANITLFHVSGDENKRYVIDQTLAWSAQLGAQVQVIQNKVFYNVLDYDTHACQTLPDFLFPSPVYNNPQYEQNHHINGKLSVSACHRSLKIHGRVYDLTAKSYVNLKCPIYHVSMDGQYTSSVNLWEIQHTQKGYGIDWLGLPSPEFIQLQQQAHGETGIWVNDVQRNTCVLQYTTSEIAHHLQLNNPTDLGHLNRQQSKLVYHNIYGFHTKWSSDSQWLMFVLRTIEKPSNANKKAHSHKHSHKNKGRVRVQHLVVLKNTLLKNDGGDVDGKKDIKYILSWASKPFLIRRNHSSNNEHQETIILSDGNHPNWKPNSHIITMNLQLPSHDIHTHNSNSTTTSGNSANIDANNSSWSSFSSPFTLERVSKYMSTLSAGLAASISAIATGDSRMHALFPSVSRKEWFTVAIDIQQLPSTPMPLFHRRFHRVLNSSEDNRNSDRSSTDNHSHRNSNAENSVLPITIVASIGLGHPSLSPDGRWLITDTYPKETQSLQHHYPALLSFAATSKYNDVNDTKNGIIFVPILLFSTVKEIGIGRQQVVKLMDVPVAAAYPSKFAHLHTQVVHYLSRAIDYVSSPYIKNSATADYSTHSLVTSTSDYLANYLQDEHVWRCDAHPAWSPSGRLLALNIYNATTKMRQVLIVNISSVMKQLEV